MSEIYDMGIQVVIFVQNLGGWLLKPMQFLSMLGSATFFLLVTPVLYWCVSTEAGLRVGLFLMFSGTINDALKLAFHAPRPYWYSKDIKALAAEMQFGIPSGHSQHAVVVWSILAAWIKRRWAWAAAIVLILCISFSRLYLGVHFPTDVLVGWLVGILLVWGFLCYERKLIAWFLSQSLIIQFLVALLISLGMIGLVTVARLSVGNWHMPSDWAENAARAGEGIPKPLDLTGVNTNAGVLFGMIAGTIVLRQNGGFIPVKGTAWQMTARYFLGLGGTLILWYGLGLIFPREADILSCLLRYLRYALVGMWFTGLAPLAFIRLGLAESQPRR